MAIHRKKEEGRVAARLPLESDEPVELPEAEVNEAGVTLEREEFRPYLPELLEELRDGCWAKPVPVVMTDSLFAIDAETRTFWVRLWHTDESRTTVDRVHVTSCLPLTRGVRLPAFVNLDGDEDDEEVTDEVDEA